MTLVQHHFNPLDFRPLKGLAIAIGTAFSVHHIISLCDGLYAAKFFVENLHIGVVWLVSAH